MGIQYRVSTAVNKVRIEPAVIAFVENTTSSKFTDQNDGLLQKKTANLPLFQMDDKQSECRELVRKFQNFIFSRVKLNLSSAQLFVLFWLSL